MVLYALFIVVSIKYIVVVMRADNQGEGGILALTALVPTTGKTAARQATPVLIALGIFGAALLYGDGMITPAISVLGDVEGLQVETPLFAPYVVPMSVAILFLLFLFQKYGTHRVGRLFGPIMVVWFVTIAGLGISWIVREPAVIIASQALISGAFSLTQQAIQLGYAPRLDIEHTSSREMGQVYVPQVNWALMISTIFIVIGFGSSSALAAAYGIAVTMTMVITAVLLHVIAVERWKWPVPMALAITAVFLTIDLTFFGANLLKLFQGGWLPILIGACIFTVMTTWKTGRRLVAERLVARAIAIDHFLEVIAAAPPIRVPGSAVFMTAQPRGIPPALAHNLRHNKMLHEHVVLLTVGTTPVPHLPDDQRLTVDPIGPGIFTVRVLYGFMEEPHVPQALHEA